MVTISIVLCPIFYLPMIGYQANGLIRFVDLNLAIPAIFTVYCLLGETLFSCSDHFHFYALRSGCIHNASLPLPAQSDHFHEHELSQRAYPEESPTPRVPHLRLPRVHLHLVPWSSYSSDVTTDHKANDV